MDTSPLIVINQHAAKGPYKKQNSPHIHGASEISRGATQIVLAANSLTLYRAYPSNSSSAAPEWNNHALLLSFTDRQLSE